MSKVVPLLETIFQNRGGSSKLWKATNEVLLQKSDEAKHFCTFMKSKLKDMNQDTQLLALDFIDYSVDDGKMPLWTQVSSKEFLTTLITLLKTRDSPEVSSKILFLIEKWGKRFEKYQEILPNFTEIYKSLKSSNVIFPNNMQSTYSAYLVPDREDNYSNSRPNLNDDYSQPYQQPQQSYPMINQSSTISYSQSIKVDLRQSSYEKKYRKLVDKLAEWINSIEVLNEKIDKAGGRVDDTIKSIANSLRHGNKQLVDTISSEKLKDEFLMEISLGVAEDVNRTLKRFDCLSKGRKPDPFLSYFVEINAKNSEPTHTMKKEPVAINSTNQVNLLEGFDTEKIQPNQYAEQPKNINQKRNDTVDDLFDIFSNPEPINVNINMSNNMPFNPNNFNQPPYNNQPPQSYPMNNLNPIGNTYGTSNQQLDNRQNDVFSAMNFSNNQEPHNSNYPINYNNFDNPMNNMSYIPPNQPMNANPPFNQPINYSPNQIGFNAKQLIQMNANTDFNKDMLNMGYNINNQFNSQSPSYGIGTDPQNNVNTNLPSGNNQSSLKAQQEKLDAIDLLF